MFLFEKNIMKAWDIDIDTDFSGILLDEKLYKEKNENIIIYHISCKTSTGSKPLRIWYNIIDRFIKIHNNNNDNNVNNNWIFSIIWRVMWENLW